MWKPIASPMLKLLVLTLLSACALGGFASSARAERGRATCLSDDAVADLHAIYVQTISTLRRLDRLFPGAVSGYTGRVERLKASCDELDSLTADGAASRPSRAMSANARLLLRKKLAEGPGETSRYLSSLAGDVMSFLPPQHWLSSMARMAGLQLRRPENSRASITGFFDEVSYRIQQKDYRACSSLIERVAEGRSR